MRFYTNGEVPYKAIQPSGNGVVGSRDWETRRVEPLPLLFSVHLNRMSRTEAQQGGRRPPVHCQFQELTGTDQSHRFAIRDRGVRIHNRERSASLRGLNPERGRVQVSDRGLRNVGDQIPKSIRVDDFAECPVRFAQWRGPLQAAPGIQFAPQGGWGFSEAQMGRSGAEDVPAVERSTDGVMHECWVVD